MLCIFTAIAPITSWADARVVTRDGRAQHRERGSVGVEKAKPDTYSQKIQALSGRTWKVHEQNVSKDGASAYEYDERRPWRDSGGGGWPAHSSGTGWNGWQRRPRQRDMVGDGRHEQATTPK